MTFGQWRIAVRARGACERCGRDERLHAHHCDHDETNHTLENGECLCVWCHDEEHNRGGALIAWDTAVRVSNRNKTDETRAKLGVANTGKKRSAETRQRNSEASQSQSPESRKKQGEAMKRWHAEHPNHAHTTFLGKRHTEETKAKLSAAMLGVNKGRVPWNKKEIHA